MTATSTASLIREMEVDQDPEKTAALTTCMGGECVSSVSSRRTDLPSPFPKVILLPRTPQGKENIPAKGSQPAPVPALE